MTINTHSKSFKCFSPLGRLNSGVSVLDIFNNNSSKPFELSFRAKRFAACIDSFDRNTTRLHRLLDSIAKHFNISYNSKDRQQSYQHQFVMNPIHLENDLLLFFTLLKILLDNMAFFVPFYFKDSIKYDRKITDLRDAEYPPSFRGLIEFFFKHEDIDREFVGILRANETWIKEICDTRNFLTHRFHDISAHNDCWTQACFAFLYEFNEIKDFIPNALTYVAKMYYNFVKFTIDFERHFKNRCHEQFPKFKYSMAGQAFASGFDKTHIFFAGLGRLLKNNILIRIAPGQRNHIPKILEYYMREEEVVCNICGAYKIQIQPTIEDHVIISSHCDCAKSLPISLRVEKKLYPHFMDQNQRHVIDRLISYDTKISLLNFKKTEH